MGKTRIKSIIKSETVYYGDKNIVNFWEKINNKSNTQEDNNNLKQIISVLNEVQNSVICIQTEKLNHPEILEAIHHASKKRNRIYILTNEKDADLKQLEGVCLIRYGIKNIGSFILINPNTNNSKGIIFTAPFIETSLANTQNNIIFLDNEQIKTLFRHFADNFWHKAEFEIIEDFSKPLKAGEPPLDFFPNIQNFCDVNFVKDKLSEINKDATISIPHITNNDILNLNNLKKSKILTSLENNDDEVLLLLASDNSIYANKNNYLRLIISADNEGWLIPKTNISNDDNFYALELNNQQIRVLKDKLDQNIENAEYKFHLSLARKKIEKKTIRLHNNIEKEIEIKSKSTKELRDIELKELPSKEEFERLEPKFIDDNVSVSITYYWKIIPFFTPEAAQKAKLYSDWEKYQSEYNAFIIQIERALNESENINISDKLKRWFLGKHQAISKQKEILNTLKNIDLSNLEKNKRDKKIKELNELAQNSLKQLQEIEAEIKKHKIEEDIEKLKEEKKEKEEELISWNKEEEKKLKDIEENRENRLKHFLVENNIKREELQKYKSGLIGKAGKKNRKKNPKEAENARKKLDELKEIEGFDFRGKYEEEKKKKIKRIENIDNEIKSKEKELEKIEKHQQSNEGSSLNSVLGKEQNNKNLIQNKEFYIPSDIKHLPQIGTLFELGEKKYLEIEFWEDYEIGKKEAERLNAKLCAKPIKE